MLLVWLQRSSSHFQGKSSFPSVPSCHILLLLLVEHFTVTVVLPMLDTVHLLAVKMVTGYHILSKKPKIVQVDSESVPCCHSDQLWRLMLLKTQSETIKHGP